MSLAPQDALQSGQQQRLVVQQQHQTGGVDCLRLGGGRFGLHETRFGLDSGTLDRRPAPIGRAAADLRQGASSRAQYARRGPFRPLDRPAAAA
jgi:hypothetical protein